MTTSLRTRSHYSCGIAIGTPSLYVEVAKEKGLTSLAITDRCTMGGALDFYNISKKSSFPIAIGVEFSIDYGGDLDTLPIALICYNQEGYTNLCRLVTSANSNNKVLNLQEIYDYNGGLYCITPEIRHQQALTPIFNEKLFFELTPYKDSKKRNLDIVLAVSPEQVVVTSDAYMPDESYKLLQDIMYKNSTFGKKENLFDHSRYMMGLQPLLQNFVNNHKDIPKDYLINGVKNADKITTHCSKLELKFQDQIVDYPHKLHPLNTDGVGKEELLRRIIASNNQYDLDDPVYRARLEYEIDAITNNSRINLIDYFLVLEDLCRYCRSNDIPVGPGRGSGAGSLVLFGLMVTRLDPIKYGLLFERFISKGRIEAGTLPDVDLDFANQDVVREYLTDLYGESRVKPIGTYQTLATRGALKDIFRVLYPDFSFLNVNKVTSYINDELREEGDTEAEFYQRQLDDNAPFSKIMDDFPKVSLAVKDLVGANRVASQHACGLAITQDPAEEFLPIRFNKEEPVLEYTGAFCEQSGVIKFDILGLKTLKFFQSCLRSLKDIEGTPKTVYDIPLDDQKTYDAFMAGDTESVFQFSSEVAKGILRKVKIESLEDLSMITSLGRPGPMKNGQHIKFIGIKNDEILPTPPHPALEEALRDTSGIMIYQESVMRCAQIMGGYSLVETDNIRKAMGKKKIKVLMPYKKGFIKHCQEKYPDTRKNGEGGVSKAEEIWHLMETFTGYGFCHAHAVSYSLISYYCQYLKVHYPLEWWAACLEHAGSSDHLKAYYSACKEHITLPTINGSRDAYFIQDSKIVMPFSSIKNVGDKASRAIQEAMPYSSFEDFFKRVNKRACNKKVVVNMIFAGAFDCFESDKETLLGIYYKLKKEKKIPSEHQNTTRDYELEQKYGVMDFLTLDYIDLHKDILSVCKYPSEVLELEEDSEKEVNIVGKITKLKKLKIKNGRNAGNTFYVLAVSNKDDDYNVIVWTEQVGLFREKLIEKNSVVIAGFVSKDRDDKSQITAKSVHTISEIREFGGLGL